MQATLFVTCLADTFYPSAARATANVLERLGYAVSCPPGQTCCGQPMFNAGHFRESRKVARHFVDVFRQTDGPIVGPSGSCVAMVRCHYPRLFEDDATYRDEAHRIGQRLYVFSEFLTGVAGFDPAATGARWEGSVTYHYSCHLRLLGLTDEPIRLIRAVSGVDYRPLERMDQCCGFGGTFSVTMPHLSKGLVADKVEHIHTTGAEHLVFSDAGCAMNITGYANRIGRPIRGLHLAEFLDRAMGAWS